MMSSENEVMSPEKETTSSAKESDSRELSSKDRVTSSENRTVTPEIGMMSSENGVMSLSGDEEDREWIYGARGLATVTEAGSEASPIRAHRPSKEMSACGASSTTNDSASTTTATSQVINLSPCNSLLWEGSGKAPAAMRRGTATVSGDTVYLNSCDSHAVYGYRDITTSTMSWRGEEREVRGQWFRLPDYPVKFFSLVVVGSKVTGVGGIRDGFLRTTCSNVLLCLERGQEGWKWVRGFPAMPTPRGFVGVIATATHLIVAGGGSMEKKLTAVEVLDIELSQWTTTIPLPQPLTSLSMVLLEGTVYFGGFFTQRDECESSLLASQSVLACSLDGLLLAPTPCGAAASDKQKGVVSNNGGCSSVSDTGMASVGGAYSKQALNEGVGGGASSSCKQGGVALNGESGASCKPSSGASSEVAVPVNQSLCGWRNIKELPTACSTLVTLGNRLVAVGGVLLSGPYSSEVYVYDPRDDSWSVIGRLGVQRSLPIATVIGGNRLIVVGGLMPDYMWGGTNRSEGVEYLSATL